MARWVCKVFVTRFCQNEIGVRNPSNKSVHKISTAYLINILLTYVYKQEGQTLNNFRHDIPTALPNAGSLHTN